jgi:SAM-dependent methyltransferase
MRPEVTNYYQRGGEQVRLSAGAGRLEFLRTWDVLTRFLPAAPASMVDVGGATGVYARPLAEAGYRVHVIDPVAAQVEVAAGLAGVTASVGEARALDIPDASADAVLLLGPLYHLTDRDDRLAAWREARRVVRPDGVVVAATISRFASVLDGFAKGFLADPAFETIVRDDLRGGQHRNPDNVPGWFTTAYFHHPAESRAEAEEAGLVVDRVVFVEGPLWMVDRLGEVLADEVRTHQTLDLLREIEAEPSLLGASAHLLVIAHGPRAGHGPERRRTASRGDRDDRIQRPYHLVDLAGDVGAQAHPR